MSKSNVSPVANGGSSPAGDRIKELSRGQDAAIGTAISVGFIALLVLALFLGKGPKPSARKEY